MTKAMQYRVLLVGGMIVAAGTPGASADDGPTTAAEKVLKDKGLTKDDRKFLLDESAALKQYEEAKAAYAAFQKALYRYAAIVEYDEAVQTMETQRQALQQEVAALQMQLRNTGTGSGRMRAMVNAQLAPLRQQVSQGQAMINQINTEIQASKGKAPKADDRKTAPEELKRTRQAYIDSVRDLNGLVAPLLATYHELALEKTVTDALAQLRHSTTLNYKLGPSDQLVAASKLIQDVKKNTSGAGKPASKKKAKAKGS
ncbi:MAG: hypothetical protein P4L84_27710 [Isosphaeraceae bacterium]|nr:hypothetical protein [Isosphaeraceae bacterium]